MYNEINTQCLSDSVLGKNRLKEIAILPDSAIRFIFFGGMIVVWECYGDCCSETWIDVISGVEKAIGKFVTGVVFLDMPEKDDGKNRQEVDLFYGIRLYLDYSDDYLQIEFRNSSNGFYGGTMEVSHGGYPSHGWIVLKSDYQS